MTLPQYKRIVNECYQKYMETYPLSPDIGQDIEYIQVFFWDFVSEYVREPFLIDFNYSTTAKMIPSCFVFKPIRIGDQDFKIGFEANLFFKKLDQFSKHLFNAEKTMNVLLTKLKII